MSSNVLEITPTNRAPGVGLDDSRADLAVRLWSVLADSTVLMHKTLGCHWNVTGPLFTSVHELTEGQYQDIFAAIDELAERIRALGYVTHYAGEKFVSASDLSGQFSDHTAAAMIGELVEDHTSLANKIREATSVAEDAGDQVTADLLTARLAFHEKAIWMLRVLIAE